MRVIAIINQKGGVGKTTTTMNLAHALARDGYRVLAIDLDPQANLSVGLGVTKKPQMGVADILINDASLFDMTEEVRDNLELLPAGDKLGEFEYIRSKGSQRGFLLQYSIRESKAEKDFILIDCPPTSGILGMNALLAANEVIIPVAGDYYSLQGLSRQMQIFDYVENTLNRHTKKWLVLTRYNDRRKLARKVRDSVVHYFPNRVLQTPIRETVALAESPSYGKTIFDYQAKNRGATDYQQLAWDVVEGRVETQGEELGEW
ncbi:MAG: ParA family protein [Gammaproteobacteria bacterium]|nr:ParA family protein [Gammaproteobacteria bacterium]